jgi:hypothetical protein
VSWPCDLGSAQCGDVTDDDGSRFRRGYAYRTERRSAVRSRRRAPPPSPARAGPPGDSFPELLPPTHTWSISSTTRSQFSTQNTSFQRASRARERSQSANWCGAVTRRGARSAVRSPHEPAHNATRDSRPVDARTGDMCGFAAGSSSATSGRPSRTSRSSTSR